MKWRVLMWLVVIIAIYAKAGLAVDAAAAGVGQTAGLAGVLVGLCGLVALVGVGAWTRQWQETARPQEAPRLPEIRMDVRGAPGIQTRDSTAQHNYLR